MSTSPDGNVTFVFDPKVGRTVRVAQLNNLAVGARTVSYESLHSSAKVAIFKARLLNGKDQIISLDRINGRRYTLNMPPRTFYLNGQSADHSTLAVQETDSLGERAVVFYALPNLTRLPNQPEFVPTAIAQAWSPIGRQFAYLHVTQTGAAELVIGEPGNRKFTAIPFAPSYASYMQRGAPVLHWSPDGKFLTVYNASVLDVVNVQTQTVSRVSAIEQPQFSALRPTWVGKAHRLVFFEAPPVAPRTSLMAYDPETGDRTMLAEGITNNIQYGEGNTRALIQRVTLFGGKAPESLSSGSGTPRPPTQFLATDMRYEYALLDLETGTQTIIRRNVLGTMTDTARPSWRWQIEENKIVMTFLDSIIWLDADYASKGAKSEIREVKVNWDMPLFDVKGKWLVYRANTLESALGLINLETGEQRILNKKPLLGFRIMQLSPDGRYVAVGYSNRVNAGTSSNHNPPTMLNIIRLEDGQEATFETTDAGTYNVLWSPDSAHLAYLTSTTSSINLYLLTPDGALNRRYNRLLVAFSAWSNCAPPTVKPS